MHALNDNLRMPTSFALACLVTLFLFWLMQYLITPPQGVGRPAAPAARLEMVTVEPEPPEPPSQAQTAAAAAAPPPPPSLPALKRPNAPKIKAAEFDISVPDIDIPVQVPSATGFGSSFGGFAGGSGSGGGGGGGGYVGGGSGSKPLVPLSTARPQIPDYACEKGIEGWVEAVFVVNTNGRVSNVRIIDAEPKGLFEAAMVQSVSNWMYPRLDRPAEVTQRVDMLVEDCQYNWKQ